MTEVLASVENDFNVNIMDMLKDCKEKKNKKVNMAEYMAQRSLSPVPPVLP